MRHLVRGLGLIAAAHEYDCCGHDGAHLRQGGEGE